MGFSRQEYLTEEQFPGMEPTSPELQVDSLPPEPPRKPCTIWDLAKYWVSNEQMMKNSKFKDVWQTETISNTFLYVPASMYQHVPQWCFSHCVHKQNSIFQSWSFYTKDKSFLWQFIWSIL